MLSLDLEDQFVQVVILRGAAGDNQKDKAESKNKMAY